MKIKTRELTGAALDWAVAKCQDWATEVNDGLIEFQGDLTHYAGDYCNPSEDWAQGGPIVEREGISIVYDAEVSLPKDQMYWATAHPIDAEDGMYGPTPLIAAMRCYVASKLGDEVEIPQKEADHVLG